ncbi:M48 family metallopeptidase [Pararhizobium sp.]|uniref:M48 family metallopeptidase n=1 Tax=Pararhizobium sp. TaxID=1977563 RepID=UPI00271D366A|nr:M48 family metallopeptidase [Pararhizobium sp.]MDO9418307.1 M48 family metallopeptidase [Pararhizobium sp.]
MASEDRAIAEGDWHPAHSSRAVPSRLVKRGEDLVVLSHADGGELSRQGVQSVQMSQRVGSIPRRITFADETIFETADNDGVDRYLRDAGKGGGGWVHGLEEFRPRLAAFVVLVFLLGSAIYRWGLPALVEVAVAVTPPIVPELMSQSTLKTLDQLTLKKSELPPERQKAIADGFARIAAQSGRGPSAYTINFRSGGLIGPNAFALPDGTLIVTDELIEMAEKDDEMIIGVMAHEIGHVELEHSLRQLYRAAGVAGLIMLIAGDIGSGAEDILVEGGGLLALSYSRSSEAAADRHSVELMKKAGYDPTAIARFFEMMETKLGDKSSTSMLSSHPGTPERRKAILDYDLLLKGGTPEP